MPPPVKLICGLLATGGDALDAGVARLQSAFGAVDHTSEIIPFTFSDYYADEMGPSLVRQYLAFAHPIDPGELPDIKNAAIEMEKKLAREETARIRRTVNIDPGYLTAAKLVLASTKDYSHRLYLRDGIYAELTLSFNRRGCLFYPWTYADYQSAACTAFLLEVRQAFIKNSVGRAL